MSKSTSVLCLLIGLISVISIVFLTWTILAFTSFNNNESQSTRGSEQSESLDDEDSVIVVLPSEGYESMTPATTSSSYPVITLPSLTTLPPTPLPPVRDFVIPYKLPPNSESDSSPEFLDNTLPPENNSWFTNNKPNRFSGPPSITHYDSGHFRSASAPIWDPHPEYKFMAFGKNFHLVLSPAEDFLSPTFRVTTHESNFTWRETTGGGGNGNNGKNKCFYRGHVVGDEDSSVVAVSLCHGMTGHIRTSWGSYFIEPAESWKGPNHPILHEIYSIPPILFVNHEDPESHDHYHDSKNFFQTSSPSNSRFTQNLTQNSQRRKKRSMSKERYVELMVVADSTMSAYHGDNLRHYVLTLLSIVALVYKDASIGNPVNIALVKFHVLRDKDFRWRGAAGPHNELFKRGSTDSGTASYGISAAEMLRNFCKWQKEENTVDDNSIYHHDTALLLTRETICRNPYQQKCDTLGLAELGTMCDHYASCAIVQDNGLSAAFTIAHELGHVLNMPHDDDTKCQPFISPVGSAERTNSLTPYQSHYVMSRMLDHNTYPWAWSKCSRHYLTEFLDAGHGSCLEDAPQANMLDVEETNNPTGSRIARHGRPQPGEIFSENRQCQLVFGPTSQLCSYMPVCRRLWCTTGESGSEEEGCRTQHMPWADGTPCSLDKWCQRGECVPRDLEKLREVHGGWGQWQAFGQCSRACGGGVRRSIRECDNPLPSNGGKYCVGPRVQYESCNTHECSGEHKDFRAEQCAEFNQDNFNIQGLPKDVQWVPKYTGISPKDRCKLFCRVLGSSAYYLLKEKVVDGTLCGPDTFDICVNGKCLPAGCDRSLHSDKVLDRCGICGGNNVTCRTQSGSYNESKYGYSSVFTIPAGASSIDVRQRGYNNSERDDNYLAILDPGAQEYILNGHFIVSMFRKIVHVAGTSIEYSGSDSIVERINSSSKPLKSDLLIQVLSVGKLYAPDINYQYTISLHPESPQSQTPAYSYEWKGSDRWTKCTQLCYGTRYREIICVEKYRNQEVEPRYCQRSVGDEGPSPTLVPCNEDCHLVWKVIDSSPCSVTCGTGRKNLVVRCVQLFSNTTYFQVSDSMCDPVTRPEDTETCSETCNVPSWRYSAWSTCSARCGGDGTMTRAVECVDSFSNQVDTRYCLQLGDPVTTKNCPNNSPCGHWKIDQWSPCSATCGAGVTRALYACYQNHQGGAILPKDFCYKDQPPISERPCEMPPCVKWEVDEWTGCSTSCGHGQMTRRVFCIDETGHSRRNDTLCELNNLLKPDNRKECNMGQCPYDSREKYTHDDENSLDSPQTSALIQSLNTAGQYGWKVDPWTECFNDYTRNKRIRERRVTCISMNRFHPVVEDYLCRGTKPPNTEECEEQFQSSFFWWTGEWDDSYCRPPSCIERRIVRCLADPGSQSAPETKCPREVPVKIRPCRIGSCSNNVTIPAVGPSGAARSGRINRGFGSNSTWRLGPWSKCSQLCGGGRKLRQVVCQYENGTLSYSCDSDERPPYSTSCNPDPCPVWHLGSWRDCTAECGGGIQERRVVCRDLHGKHLPDYSCDIKTKPGTSQPCHEDPCSEETNEITGPELKIRYRWHFGNWSECSKKCGKGIKKRKVECIKLSTTKLYPNEPVSDSFCSHIPKPKEENACKRFPCPYQWVTSHWSECSILCGYGIQQRTVTCHKVNKLGWVDPDPLPSACENIEKPKEYQYCFDADCNSQFGWRKEPWTICPDRCGKQTRQKRRVYCARKSNGQRVGGHFCPRDHKPMRRRKCPIKPCIPTSCGELQSSGVDRDGNYTLFVGGKNVTIYCKDMGTGLIPKEYLNLPDDNYSEVYSKRLIRPETCPREGQRLDTCECIEDSNRRSGYTIFHKLKLNVTNLRVNTEDFSFITQVTGRNEIGFGQSGDCYSSANCPQGRFSINLDGTGLSVSSSTLWISNGHKASISITRSQDNVRITAKCGGYCGNCVPSQLTGLKLEVT